VSRTGGKSALYLDLLKCFVSDYTSFGQQVGQFLREERRDDARRLAHSLKGVAANLGARRIASAAGHLEEALRRGEPAESALAHVEHQLGPLLGQLFNYFGHTSQAPPQPEADRAGAAPVFPQWVGEFHRLLAAGDVEAQRLWSRRGGELDGILSVDAYARLRRAVENFEFDAALDALRHR